MRGLHGSHTTGLLCYATGCLGLKFQACQSWYLSNFWFFSPNVAELSYTVLWNLESSTVAYLFESWLQGSKVGPDMCRRPVFFARHCICQLQLDPDDYEHGNQCPRLDHWMILQNMTWSTRHLYRLCFSCLGSFNFREIYIEGLQILIYDDSEFCRRLTWGCLLKRKRIWQKQN